MHSFWVSFPAQLIKDLQISYPSSLCQNICVQLTMEQNRPFVFSSDHTTCVDMRYASMHDYQWLLICDQIWLCIHCTHPKVQVYMVQKPLLTEQWYWLVHFSFLPKQGACCKTVFFCFVSPLSLSLSLSLSLLLLRKLKTWIKIIGHVQLMGSTNGDSLFLKTIENTHQPQMVYGTSTS